MKLRMYMSPEMLITPEDDEKLGGDGRTDTLVGEYETLEHDGRIYLLSKEGDATGYDPAALFDPTQKAAKDAVRAAGLAKLTDEEKAELGLATSAKLAAKDAKAKP